MTTTLQVRWRDVVYDVETCLDEERAAESRAHWPDGVLELATLLDPERKSSFGKGERIQLVARVLRACGEPMPQVFPRPQLAKAAPKVVGAFAPAPEDKAEGAEPEPEAPPPRSSMFALHNHIVQLGKSTGPKRTRARRMRDLGVSTAEERASVDDVERVRLSREERRFARDNAPPR